MGVNVDDPEDLRGQVEDLRSRLEEAEETLRAIRCGEVDALVVHEPGGDRVYTFQWADHAYRLLIEQMNEGAATLSLEGRILYGNRRLGEMVKAPLGRVIGSSLASFIDEGDRESLGRLLVAGRCERIQGDLCLRALDGTSIPVQVSLTPLRFEGFSGIGAILTDLSIRKQAEESANRLAAIIQATDDAIVSKSLDGTILSWNPGAERMYGYSEAQVLGQSFSMMLPEGAVDDWPVIVEKIKRGERVEHYETTRRRKDGQSLHVSLSSSPLRDPAGKVVGAAAIARDITERKRAEEALRRASAYNRRLIEASLDPLVTIGPDGKITDVNEATEAATGYPRAELIGKDFADYFTEPEEAREGYRRVFREGLVRDYALEIQNRDGHTIPVLYNATIYRDEAGGVAGVIAAARDITERKRAAALLERHAAELARSNRELEQFAYVASHDLQEPLRMVASYVELLSERYKGRLDEKADKFISYAVDGAARMKTLIDDLLRYSRVTTQARRLEEMEARAALDEAMANLGRAIAEKGAVVTHDDLPTVLANPTQFVQLFQNLIGNGLKFCDGTPRVHVTAERNGEEWVFSVRDNGIGIAPEHRERIFNIFQRLHGRDKYTGTGMGLAICKRLVERHGGRIWVESRPGQGSTFFFTLPVARSKLS